MAALSKVREDLAQAFVTALNQGQLPWQKCWSQALPMNAVTGKNYRGVNALMLSFHGDKRKYTDTRWCTYRQAQEKGWQVRKGEKGVKVEYWACYDTKEKKLLSWDDVHQKLKADPDYQENLQLRCRTYTVFNGEQMDGIPALQPRQTNIGALRDKRDVLIHNMGISYQEQGIRAYYSPGMDMVTLPPEASFDDTYSYMATFLHECGHASGHETRLNRDLTGFFGSESYAREELRAEIASAFTAQSLGLQLTDEQLQYQTEHHVAYVQSWANILQDSPDELFRAIKEAEGISDYLLQQLEYQPEPDVTNGTMGEVGYTLSPLPEGNGMELRIHGQGAIPDFDDVATRPYQAHAAAIRKVVIEDGITAIGAGAISEFPALEKLSRPRSIPWIRPQDLESCRALKEIELTGEKQSWMNYKHTHSPKDLLDLADKYSGFTVEQLDEIAAGIRDGLVADQIAVYARREFDPLQMNALRYCVADGLPREQLTLIADPAFNSVQMDIIRSGFQCGMTMEQVSTFAKPEIQPQQMLDSYWAIRNDPDWVPSLPAEPKEPPMEQVPVFDFEP